MISPDLLKEVIISFTTLLIILDPFLGVAVFVSLTKKLNPKEKAKEAFTAVIVAFSLLIFFLFIGIKFLELMGVTLSSFSIAGGLILLIMGIQTVLGIEFSKGSGDKQAAAVIIGTPLLCGPGAITTVILLSQKYGFLPPLIAVVLVTLVTWVMLFYSNKISKILGERFLEIISRVLGLVLAAIAIGLIQAGLTQIIIGS